MCLRPLIYHASLPLLMLSPLEWKALPLLLHLILQGPDEQNLPLQGDCPELPGVMNSKAFRNRGVRDAGQARDGRNTCPIHAGQPVGSKQQPWVYYHYCHCHHQQAMSQVACDLSVTS